MQEEDLTPKTRKTKLAEDLAKRLGVHFMVDTFWEGIRNRVIDCACRNNLDQKILLDTLVPENDRSNIFQELVRVYEDNFTEADLCKITDFVTFDPGKKMISHFFQRQLKSVISHKEELILQKIDSIDSERNPHG